jgi:uncharacterized protein
LLNLDKWLNFGKFLAIAYLTICLVLFFGQNRLIFFPPKTLDRTPAAFNLRYQDVWLPVSNQSGSDRMHGWWIPNDRSRDTLLYFHGNGGNVSTEVGMAYRFHQLGLSVLLIDYRGYGQSEGGFPSESAVYQDAQTAWDYLIQEQKVSAKKIMIYGHSLGGAIAINLATQHPEAAGLIVQSSFTSLQAMAAGDWKFRLFPIELILTQKFDSIAKVPFLKTPVLFIHGMADLVVPESMSRSLYQAASQPKQLLLVPNGGHNDTDLIFETPQILAEVRKFIKRAMDDI